MKKTLIITLLVIITFSCKEEPKESVTKTQPETVYTKPVLDTKSANYLYHFAFDCIDQEYPNKLGQVLGDATYLKEPSELHPAFYGCFDWHSSVHGHWTLLNILRELPNFEHKEAIWKKLNTTITKQNILKEVAYFDDAHNKSFERTYGWAWLLKVSETLQDWNTPEAQKLNENLKPLVDLIEKKYVEFLPKLKYPIRVGEHPNTAFGMSFALDYAQKYAPQLEEIIIAKSKEYYLNDIDCPVTWEPGGFDFLSPCLQEASLMLKVLPKDEYIAWLDAWCLYEIGNELGNEKMLQLANKHFDYSYKKMDSGEYAGAHWLASFALYATLKSN